MTRSSLFVLALLFCFGCNSSSTGGTTIISASALWSLDLAAPNSPPYMTGKAAIGAGPSDFWNSQGPLKDAAGVQSSIAVNLTNYWASGSNDSNVIMLSNYAYANGVPLGLTITGLSAGTYSFYVYACESADHGNSIDVRRVPSGGSAIDLGTENTSCSATDWNASWVSGSQYRMFSSSVSAGDSIEISINATTATSPSLNGVQILRTGN